MMKILALVLSSLFFSISIAGCTKESDTASSKAAVNSNLLSIEWEEVMHVNVDQDANFRNIKPKEISQEILTGLKAIGEYRTDTKLNVDLSKNEVKQTNIVRFSREISHNDFSDFSTKIKKIFTAHKVKFIMQSKAHDTKVATTVTGMWIPPNFVDNN
jgi:hypothetical protein